MAILASFWKPKACGQTVIPDRSVLIEQKLVENAKIQMLFWWIFKHCVQKFFKIGMTQSFVIRQLYKEGLRIYFGENKEGVAQQEIILFWRISGQITSLPKIISVRLPNCYIRGSDDKIIKSRGVHSEH